MDRSSPQRWPDIEQVLDRALELGPHDRAAFLDGACQGNPALRAEVERLLRAAERADGFLATPAPAYAAPLVERLARAEVLPPGTRLGGYEIERELGHGGMATVWLAEDVRHHRRVAIKVLHPELSAVLGSGRFLKEIELTANLQHPHILPLFDSGEAAGHLYYVMPYVEGESLRNRLVRERQLPIADAIRIATDVADALAYAHRHGVVHRDIKPENILLHDGRPVVADFGIALAVQQAGGERMTQTGLSLGTPQYMAPEQATGERTVDLRADVYALGAVTYEMLSGEPPFTGPTAQAVVARMLTEAPPPLATRPPA
jgi:eukaryotic-like serine/threonine-protein kinase